MFSFLQGSERERRHNNRRTYSPFARSPDISRNRNAQLTVDDDDFDEDEDVEEDEFSPLNRPTSYFDRANLERYEDGAEEGEDEDAVYTPLLPIFSAAHLDKLPLYNITHAIRLLIVQRCETTLSWDQLRSPQISQFLVKPIQNQIRTDQFNRATLCALIANCLQFQKEAQLHPGNVGVSTTRALMSELLAMRLIKDFTTRELIDALSYDFDPLQGMTGAPTASDHRSSGWAIRQDLQRQRTQAKCARVSTIEIAIRAQAKRFLSHQLVVQHLEAIWAGTIVFHSEADNLHRKPSSGEEPYNRGRVYGTIHGDAQNAVPAESLPSRTAHETGTNKRPSASMNLVRRSVTLYNPREASLFKLSRLRVPRYRQVFSTFSFAIMLGLFLAVLIERSLYITPLEVVFWFWSIGYMLDEVVGFTEQGFGLYILSFWNAFDVGILLLFVTYYCLRLYGILLAEDGKTRIANAAYDVLASTAILLFPRLFSVLDHYRYFSQLLIAFRMMAQDLMAILFLILISCSGFFVAFTLSFSDKDTDGRGVAYILFQILMGFTPAAWEKWSGYNVLGKALMTAFLIICHFVIVTILITVLTNSFMAIVKNAHEEHQFLFAINTISMVKSDALFGYIAPSNVMGWILSPLRFIIPFRQFVKINRIVIKLSHIPVLFAIFTYERVVMSKAAYDPMDLVEKRPRTQHQPVAFSINKAQDVFSPGRRLLREPSVISFNKDRALDEVFRRPFKGSTIRTTPRDMEQDSRKSTNVVDKWMQAAEIEGGASPPIEQPRSVVERLENRKPSFRRASMTDRVRKLARHSREFSSDPDIMSTIATRRPDRIDEEGEGGLTSSEPLPQETDADGDDENNLDSDVAGPVIGESAISTVDKENRTPQHDSDEDDLFQTPTVGKSPLLQPPEAVGARLQQSTNIFRGGVSPYQAKTNAKKMHNRKISTDTALFAPQNLNARKSFSANPANVSKHVDAKKTSSGGTATPATVILPSGQRTPKFKPVRTRPIMPPRHGTVPNLASGVGLSFLDMARASSRQPSFNARALDLASDIGDNKWVPAAGIDAGENSFSEQLLREKELQRRREEERRRTEEEEKGLVNRIMLARMHTLEEGFSEVLREIKFISHSTGNSSRIESEVETTPGASARGVRTPTPKHVIDAISRNTQKRDPMHGMKPREMEGLGMQTGMGELEALNPESAKSTTGGSEEAGVKADEDTDRPGTAVRTPEHDRRDE